MLCFNIHYTFRTSWNLIFGSIPFQNDHFNGLVQNTVLPTLPPLLPHMNMGQVGSGPILQSFNQDVAYQDSFKMESGWDPSRLCLSDITLTAEKSHHVSNCNYLFSFISNKNWIRIFHIKYFVKCVVKIGDQ